MLKKIFWAFAIIGLIVFGINLISLSHILLGVILFFSGIYLIFLVKKRFLGRNLSLIEKSFKLVVAILLFPAFALVMTISGIQESSKTSHDIHSTIDGNLFRSNQQFFRIRFPKNWVTRKGEGKNVFFKAELDDIASISVVVIPTVDSVDLNDMTNSNILNLTSTSIEVLSRNAEIELLELSVKYLCNQKCGYARFEMQDRQLQGKKTFLNHNFMTTKNGRTYIISGKVLKAEANIYENVILESISSFCIEFYYDKQ